MRFDIITIFPKILDSYFSETILNRAQKKGLIEIKIHNLRDYATDKHKTVDDKPYGGGPGMIMKADIIKKALLSVKKENFSKKQRIILLSPSGKQFTQQIAKKLAKFDNLIFICGRYEGIDARVEKFVDEKISIGPYVLSGGELATAVIIETLSRLIPGVLGKKESLLDESFKKKNFLEYPQYTRPETIKHGKKKLTAPKILLSGNHLEIEKWRKKHSKNTS